MKVAKDNLLLLVHLKASIPLAPSWLKIPIVSKNELVTQFQILAEIADWSENFKNNKNEYIYGGTLVDISILIIHTRHTKVAGEWNSET